MFTVDAPAHARIAHSAQGGNAGNAGAGNAGEMRGQTERSPYERFGNILCPEYKSAGEPMKMAWYSLFALVASSAIPPSGSVEFNVVNRWDSHHYRVLHFPGQRCLAGFGRIVSRSRGGKDSPGIYDYELEQAAGDSSSERLSGSAARLGNSPKCLWQASR
jgi:hypothetical protein